VTNNWNLEPTAETEHSETEHSETEHSETEHSETEHSETELARAETHEPGRGVGLTGRTPGQGADEVTSAIDSSFTSDADIKLLDSIEGELDDVERTLARLGESGG
jgi:hypothetical protein